MVFEYGKMVFWVREDGVWVRESKTTIQKDEFLINESYPNYVWKYRIITTCIEVFEKLVALACRLIG